MTEKVKGRVSQVADYKSNAYFNIAIGDPENKDNWFIGGGSTDADEGDKVEVKHSGDNSIKEINVLEEDNEDGPNKNGRAGSDSGNRGRGESNSGKHSSPNPKRANIQATAATKKAADIVAEHRTVEEGEFEEQVSTVAHGLNRIMNDLYEENMQ